MIYWERFRDWIDWLKRPESGASFLMPGGISGNLQWNNSGAFDGVAGSQVSTIGELLLATPARTTPSLNYYFAVRTPADLALTADTESIGIQLGGGANAATVTRQFTAGGGAFATQREIVCAAPTYAATAAETITQAATLAITNAPQAGANMTLTNAYALWVQAGLTRLDGNFLNSAAARSGTAPPYAAIRTPADTALTASAEAIGIQLGGDSSQATVTRQFATGALTTQREVVVVGPTYAFVGASTLTSAASFTITSAPAAGANATITNSYALWVQAGKTELDGVVTVAPAARSGSSQRVLQVVTPADTALTASTESILNQFGGSTAQATVTRQFATGALTTQRENLFVNPTYGFVGASTLTTAATVAIAGAPVAGTNATITNSYSFWVQAGKTELDGVVTVAPAARTAAPFPIVFQVVTPADTSLTASTEAILNQFGGSTAQATVTRQFATGALTTQRENLFVNPTYGFVGASTLTSAATVAIAAAPAAGANATITNAYALWVQAGQSAFAGNICAPSVSGTDQAGSNLVFNPGRGTGTGAPGLPVIQYPLTTSTGTTLQALSSNLFPIGTQMFLHNNGDISVTNTTTETDVIGAGSYGSKSVEAGLARAGRTWFIRLCGGLSVTGTPSLQGQLKLGSTVLADTTGIALSNNATTANGGLIVEAIVTLRTVGASATFAVHSLTVSYTASNGGATNRFAQANVGTVDLTVAQNWVFTFKWGTATNVSLTIFSTEIYMDR